MNVSGPNSPIKGYRLAEWIKTQELSIMLPIRNKPHQKRYTQTESEVMEGILLTTGKKKGAGVVILISHKVDLNIKTVKRDRPLCDD